MTGKVNEYSEQIVESYISLKKKKRHAVRYRRNSWFTEQRVISYETPVKRFVAIVIVYISYGSVAEGFQMAVIDGQTITKIQKILLISDSSPKFRVHGGLLI